MANRGKLKKVRAQKILEAKVPCGSSSLGRSWSTNHLYVVTTYFFLFSHGGLRFIGRFSEGFTCIGFSCFPNGRVRSRGTFRGCAWSLPFGMVLGLLGVEEGDEAGRVSVCFWALLWFVFLFSDGISI